MNKNPIDQNQSHSSTSYPQNTTSPSKFETTMAPIHEDGGTQLAAQTLLGSSNGYQKMDTHDINVKV